MGILGLVDVRTGGEGYGEDVYYGVDAVDYFFFGVWEAMMLSRKHSKVLVVYSEDERRGRNIEDGRDYKKLKECRGQVL